MRRKFHIIVHQRTNFSRDATAMRSHCMVFRTFFLFFYFAGDGFFPVFFPVADAGRIMMCMCCALVDS